MEKFDLIIKGKKYNNIIYKDKEFVIQYTKPNKRNRKYNNRYRLVNTNGYKDTLHTHLNNLDVCKQCIFMVRQNKLPRTAKKYLIKSCYRISNDEEYRKKALDFYNRKKNKGKQKYYNLGPTSR